MRLFYKQFKFLFAIGVCIIFSACTKIDNGSVSDTQEPKCKPSELPNQLRAVFVDDLMPNATDVTPVAVFRFTQGIKTYANTNCKTKPNECQTDLLIQNISGLEIGISYTINYELGNNKWSSDGYAKIPPDSTFNAGVVTLNCGWVSSGTMQIIKRGITYKN
jgi:hypothetical protein